MLSFKQFILQFFCEATIQDFNHIGLDSSIPEHAEMLSAWNDINSSKEHLDSLRRQIGPGSLHYANQFGKAMEEDKYEPPIIQNDTRTEEEKKRSAEEERSKIAHNSTDYGAIFAANDNLRMHVTRGITSTEQLGRITKAYRDQTQTAQEKKEETARIDAYKTHAINSGRYQKVFERSHQEGDGIPGLTIWKINKGENGQGTALSGITGGDDKLCTGGTNLSAAASAHENYDPEGTNSLLFEFHGIGNSSNNKVKSLNLNKNLRLVSTDVSSGQIPTSGAGGNFQHKGNGAVTDDDWKKLVETYRLDGADLTHILSGIRGIKSGVKYDKNGVRTTEGRTFEQNHDSIISKVESLLKEHAEAEESDKPQKLINVMGAEARLNDISKQSKNQSLRNKAFELLQEISRRNISSNHIRLTDIHRLADLKRMPDGQLEIDGPGSELGPGTELGNKLANNVAQSIKEGTVSGSFADVIKKLGHNVDIDKTNFFQGFAKRIRNNLHTDNDIRHAGLNDYIGSHSYETNVNNVRERHKIDISELLSDDYHNKIMDGFTQSKGENTLANLSPSYEAPKRVFKGMEYHNMPVAEYLKLIGQPVLGHAENVDTMKKLGFSSNYPNKKSDEFRVGSGLVPTLYDENKINPHDINSLRQYAIIRSDDGVPKLSFVFNNNGFNYIRPHSWSFVGGSLTNHGSTDTIGQYNWKMHNKNDSSLPEKPGTDGNENQFLISRIKKGKGGDLYFSVGDIIKSIFNGTYGKETHGALMTRMNQLADNGAIPREWVKFLHSDTFRKVNFNSKGYDYDQHISDIHDMIHKHYISLLNSDQRAIDRNVSADKIPNTLSAIQHYLGPLYYFKTGTGTSKVRLEDIPVPKKGGENYSFGIKASFLKGRGFRKDGSNKLFSQSNLDSLDKLGQAAVDSFNRRVGRGEYIKNIDGENHLDYEKLSTELKGVAALLGYRDHVQRYINQNSTLPRVGVKEKQGTYKKTSTSSTPRIRAEKTVEQSEPGNYTQEQIDAVNKLMGRITQNSSKISKTVGSDVDEKWASRIDGIIKDAKKAGVFRDEKYGGVRYGLNSLIRDFINQSSYGLNHGKLAKILKHADENGYLDPKLIFGALNSGSHLRVSGEPVRPVYKELFDKYREELSHLRLKVDDEPVATTQKQTDTGNQGTPPVFLKRTDAEPVATTQKQTDTGNQGTPSGILKRVSEPQNVAEPSATPTSGNVQKGSSSSLLKLFDNTGSMFNGRNLFASGSKRLDLHTLSNVINAAKEEGSYTDEMKKKIFDLIDEHILDSENRSVSHDNAYHALDHGIEHGYIEKGTDLDGLIERIEQLQNSKLPIHKELLKNFEKHIREYGDDSLIRDLFGG